MSGYLGYPPYGYRDWDQSKAHPHERMRKNWPEWLPSFEMWCAMTNYNEREEYGGGGFQRLMHYMLVEGDQKQRSIEHLKDEGFHYWPADWDVEATGKERYSMEFVKGEHKISHCSVDCGRTESPGWGAGYVQMSAQRDYGPLYDVEKTGPSVTQWLSEMFAPLTYRPISRTQYTLGMGLRGDISLITGCEGMGSQARQLHAEGGGGRTARSASDLSGCPSGGNRLAALFGLYFYEGCDEEAYNWTEEVHVTDKKGKKHKFSVRMRLPNPVYKEVNSHMIVKEKLNPAAAKAATNPEHIVNPTLGTPLPHVNPSFQQYDQIAQFTDKMKVNPQTGEVSDLPQGTRMWRLMLNPAFGALNWGAIRDRRIGNRNGPSMRELITNLASVDGMANVHRPEGDNGLMVGFRVPAAIWLYPHYTGTGQTHKQRKRKEGDGLQEPFQPLPEWRSDVDPKDSDAFDRHVIDALQDDVMGLSRLFKMPIVDDVYERMLYAVGVDDKPQRVSDIQELLKKAQVKPPRQLALASTPVQPPLPPQPPQTSQEQTQARMEPGQRPVGEAPQDAEGLDEDEQDDANNLAADTTRPPEQLDIGAPSLEEGVTNAFAETATWGGETENRYFPEERLLEKDKVAADKEAVPDFVLTGLEAGAPRRMKDKDLNYHFYSAAYNPWSQQFLYKPNESKFRMSGPMDPKAVAEYKEKYGNVANLFIRSQKLPKSILGVDLTYGDALTCPGNRKRLLWDLPITAYKGKERKLLYGEPAFEGEVVGDDLVERFRRCMVQICRIYYDGSGKLSSDISVKQKQDGMVNGITIFTCHGKDFVDTDGKKVDGYKKPHFNTGRVERGEKRALPKVFNTTPPANLAARFCPGRNNTLPTGRNAPDNYYDLDVSWVTSGMKVIEWLQTPWHYQYLPYQPLTSNFKDGETFCEGCARCARPFFEYKHRYEAYWFSERQTISWPQKYWRTKNGGPCSAPLPFHDPLFWKDNVKPQETLGSGQVVDIPKAQHVSQVNELVDGGYHNWLTSQFLIDKSTQLQYEWKLLKDRIETHKRKLVHIDKAIKDKKPFTFRKVINESFDELRNKLGVYRDLVQGKLSNANAMVRFGMDEYRLTRSTKYGNVCKDCASVLMFAPGLYMMNTRQIGSAAVYTDGKRRVNQENWWSNLASLMVEWVDAKGKKQRQPFDVDFITKRSSLAGDEDATLKWDAHMKVAHAFLVKTHCNLPSVIDKEGNVVGEMTKLKAPPEIYIQKRFDKDSKKWAKLESKAVKEATDMLEKLKAAVKHNYEQLQRSKEGKQVEPYKEIRIDGAAVTFGSAALYDLLHETQVALTHRDAYRRESNDVVKKFDPDMRRWEYRNEPHETTVNGKKVKFRNCLRVRTWQPRAAKAVPVTRKEGDEFVTTGQTKLPTEEEDYKTVIYYANRVGENGDEGVMGKDHLSSWRGDQYVINGHPNGSNEQLRTMKQSRLFITYSLHRAVSSELEARNVMEKMADAVRLLFGNDRYLCEMLLFGMKLESVKKVEDTKTSTDSISKMRYTHIPNAKKEGTLFYGSRRGNSYQYDTYETHVESIDVDAGIEIGPNKHFPHFHLLVTVNHWSYVQLDYYKMRALLEQMFKGLVVGDRDFSDGQFKLLDSGGMPFYRDSENPYIDFKLYPTDNWQDVIAAYVRKNASPGIFEALRVRTGTRG